VGALVTADGASMLAHGVHYTLVALGIAGLVALLAPTLAIRHRQSGTDAAHDLHDLRVDELRAAVDRYVGGAPVATLLADRRVQADVGASPLSTLWLPLAVTSCAGAAGIHAAMVLPHLRERALFGVFFIACTVLQLAWAERALRRPARGWLLAGAAGNLGVVALWAATRAAGLPFGLLPAPEAVGPWDVTCGVWELVAAGACLVAARRGTQRRVAPWWDWQPAAHAWFALSAVLLILLSLGQLG
jgi:hypothetical protein